MGIEPTRPAWKAGILPLNYTRIYLSNLKYLAIIAFFSRFVNRKMQKRKKIFSGFLFGASGHCAVGFLFLQIYAIGRENGKAAKKVKEGRGIFVCPHALSPADAKALPEGEAWGEEGGGRRVLVAGGGGSRRRDASLPACPRTRRRKSSPGGRGLGREREGGEGEALEKQRWTAGRVLGRERDGV